MLGDKLIETIGNIEYWKVMGGYEARHGKTVICNTNLDRLKMDAPAAIDLLKTWLEEVNTPIE